MDPLIIVVALVEGLILFSLLFLLTALVQRTGPEAAPVSASARSADAP